MKSLLSDLLEILDTTRDVRLEEKDVPTTQQGIRCIMALAANLQRSGHGREAEALLRVAQIATTSPDFGGMGLPKEGEIESSAKSELVFLSTAWLEALNSADRSKHIVMVPLRAKPQGRRPMNVTEKIFALHDVEQKGSVRPGQSIRVWIDWIMASEASWHGMLNVYNRLGDPGIFRNDRFWLAGDHVVDPRNMGSPLTQKLVSEMEMAHRTFKLTQFQGSNYTIMHTEFFRERAEPGQLVIGSDSHTCSAGANGCLAIGLGATDVTMALVTGQIWFKVPDVVEIELVGIPKRGVGGKDIILHILKELRRNTVASDRIVEYTGPGCQWLGPDARFAIANMTTEFGGITGIFAPDSITAGYISARNTSSHKSSSHYFQPDEGCEYAESHIVDIGKAEPYIARFPNPDDVVPVSEMIGQRLDGCFIGACTTAEEDIIMGALVLKAGLDAGMTPSLTGKRKVVPGSKPIANFLRNSGLAAVFEQCGFEIGIPGCSYCVGMGADMAGPGEVWLTSQNRNFENRMGRGAIGHLASAATVAASAFDMTITSPQELIDSIPREVWDCYKSKGSLDGIRRLQPKWVEPPESEAAVAYPRSHNTVRSSSNSGGVFSQHAKLSNETIKSKIFRLGDFVDTDALAPAQYLLVSKDLEELGSHCLEFTHPQFRHYVKDGHQVVVAGKAFGCGSSRQEAVQSLLGAGVKCVIAESFAFIYSRNQPSLGLLGFTIGDPNFYAKAHTGASIEIDMSRNVVKVDGEQYKFKFSDIEKNLTKLGGLTEAFNLYGKSIFDILTSTGRGMVKIVEQKDAADPLAW